MATQPREPSEGLQLNFQQVRSEAAGIDPPPRGGTGRLGLRRRGSSLCPSEPPLFLPPPQNINDSMTVLPKLSTGLDVNVRFTGVSDFEYTPECIVFDLLNVPLYHGWLVDPQVSGPPAGPGAHVAPGSLVRGLVRRWPRLPRGVEEAPCPWQCSGPGWSGLAPLPSPGGLSLEELWRSLPSRTLPRRVLPQLSSQEGPVVVVTQLVQEGSCRRGRAGGSPQPGRSPPQPLPSPQSPEVVQAVGKLSYNQLVEKIITCKQASDSRLVSEGTGPPPATRSLGSPGWPVSHPRCAPRAGGGAVPGVHGLPAHLPRALRAHGRRPGGRAQRLLPQQPLQHHDKAQGAAAAPSSPSFQPAGPPPPTQPSPVPSPQGHLYLLVTDQGFLQEEGVVWESLHTVDGDSCFCDTHFHLSHAPGREGAAATAPPDPRLQQRQVDQVGDKQGGDTPVLSQSQRGWGLLC